MEKLKIFSAICVMILGLNSYAMNNNYDDSCIVSAQSEDSSCAGFCHPDSILTDEELLANAKRYTDNKAERKCYEKDYSSAILINEYQCTFSTVPGYSRGVTCFGIYQCE